jgi:lipopolysaccharide/colanic/teichoic acid biosynthesis glycosyltransferase
MVHGGMKRLFDMTFAALGLVVLSPLFVVLAMAVKLSSRGPVLFRQERVGKDGRPFYIVKFRSMVVNAEDLGLGVTRDGDPRITAMGRFLRKTKLDELPQLWNVLVGEMSFVGPRPEVPRYVAQYTPEQRRVLALKPGITDLATLEFRREEEMLKAEMRRTEDGEINHEIRERHERGRTEDGGRRTDHGPRTTGLRRTEDGGRKTEDGLRTTDHGPGDKAESRNAEDGVEEFYLKYCVPRKIELNLEYAKSASVWQDVLIILRTLFPFLAREHGRETTGLRTTDHGQGTADCRRARVSPK